jgi:hypothetical protein
VSPFSALSTLKVYPVRLGGFSPITTNARPLAATWRNERKSVMKKMAIMKGVTFGLQLDCGKVGLSFSVYLDESSAASQFISGNEALEVIKKFGVEDVSKLNGKPCWVETDGHSFIKFLEPCKI